MKTTTLSLVALIAVTLASPALAQYKTRCEQPAPLPYPGPGPVTSGYFLGVYTSTVPVSGYGGTDPGDGPVAMVVPGYGETVYGQQIDQVVPDSPAFHAGLEPGDVIISANGYPMESKQDLVAAIQGSEGYLEMQVMDVRSGDLAWVVAETAGEGPVLLSQQRRNTNSSFNQARRQNTQRTNLAKVKTRTQNARQSTQQLTSQIRSAVETFGGRRPPVNRRR